MRSRLGYRNEGMALVMVLWVLMLLSIIALEFCYAMRTEVDICANQRDDIKGYFMARAGVERALLEMMRFTRMEGGLLREEGDVKEDESAGSAGLVDEGETEIWKADGTPYEVPFRDGKFEVRIEDEGGKVNINYASGEILRQLLNSLELPEVPSEEGNIVDVVADSILDWRDEDNLHRINGAEDDYYNGLPEPYDCKDGPFYAVEELLLVRGVTPKVYQKLSNCVTVYSDGKINVNTASPEVLRSLLLDDTLVTAVVEQRKITKFYSLDELIPLLGEGIYLAVRSSITLNPISFYTIKSTGQIEGSHVSRSVKAVVQLEGSTVYVVNWMDRWWETESEHDKS
jgi:general secretion pathway protein K